MINLIQDFGTAISMTWMFLRKEFFTLSTRFDIISEMDRSYFYFRKKFILLQ